MTESWEYVQFRAMGVAASEGRRDILGLGDGGLDEVFGCISGTETVWSDLAPPDLRKMLTQRSRSDGSQ